MRIRVEYVVVSRAGAVLSTHTTRAEACRRAWPAFGERVEVLTYTRA